MKHTLNFIVAGLIAATSYAGSFKESDIEYAWNKALKATHLEERANEFSIPPL
ncbi:MAG TPA: hypothetical protein VJG90_07160 [Candidatus Nanoarchaeia archaeon]|nr:hypothetical protein [Candidatus Nanoarchaeia archaeon]